MQRVASAHKKPIDLLTPKGGEGREDHLYGLQWMFRTDTRVTCGDLMLPSQKWDTMNLTQRQKSAES